MYASKAAEAGLVIRNETRNYIPEIQKQNEIHKDTINTLVGRLEEFIYKEYPDAVYCKVSVTCTSIHNPNPKPGEAYLALSVLVVFKDVYEDKYDWEKKRENERILRDKIHHELEADNKSDDTGWSLGLMSSSIRTIKQWNKEVRHGLWYDLDSAILKAFPGVRKNIHDLDISLTKADSSEDGIWDLKLTLVCDSLGFDNDTNIAKQYQSLDQLLKRKMEVYNKVLMKKYCLHLLRHVQILAFTEEMWKYRTNQRKEWDAFERAKKKRNSAIINDMTNKLEEVCKSDSLSVESLQEKTKLIPSKFVSGSCFLHQACFNKNVTLEIIEYLLEYHPEAANIEYTDPPRGYYDDDNCQIMKKAYPLHVACMSEACPDSVIQLLVERNPTVLTKLCLLNNGISYDYYYGGEDEPLGSPLHYYLSRNTNVDVELVRFFGTVSPDVLTAADEKLKCTPMHLLSCMENVDDLFDILQYLVENPSCLDLVDRTGRNALHVACSNAHVTSRIVQLFIDHCPDLLHRSYDDEYYGATYPIHCLCENINLSIQTSTEIVSIILKAFPEALHQNESEGYPSPIHLALKWNCPNTEFCKMLIEHHPECAREVKDNTLPIHKACNSLDLVKLLFKIYPESISMRSDTGMLPVHYAAARGNVELLKFLLEHDPTSASIIAEVPEGGYSHYEASYDDGESIAFPLLFACCTKRDSNISAVKLLYDHHPEAIYLQEWEWDGEEDVEEVTDVGVLSDFYSSRRSLSNEPTVAFLDSQADFARNAKNVDVMTTLDDNGWLPLHHACENGASLGSIKLLVNANRAAIQVATTREGLFPLHIACRSSTIDVVEYLLQKYNGCLNLCDARGDYPLHIACRRGGSYSIVNCLLRQPSAPVLERNVDNEVPIELLLNTFDDENKDVKETPEYIETLWRMLLLFPESVANVE